MHAQETYAVSIPKKEGKVRALWKPIATLTQSWNKEFYQFDVNNQDQENILTKDGPKQKKCHAKWIKTGQDQKDIDAVKLTDGSEERI